MIWLFELVIVICDQCMPKHNPYRRICRLIGSKTFDCDLEVARVGTARILLFSESACCNGG